MGYLLYQHHNDGQSFGELWFNFFNNSCFILYNASLIHKYDCHINIEICAYMQAVNHIHKYIF